MPGRDPAFQDLALNGLGAATGAALGAWGLSLRARQWIVALAAAVWLAPLVLLVPRATQHDLYGQWTSRFGRVTPYDGEILDASVGGLFVHSWRVDEKAALDSAVVDRAPIDILLVTGPPPRAWAPVFQIMDSHRQGVIELGARGSDLLLRGWDPARILKLDQPDTRWPGAMDGVTPGDTVTIVVDRGRDSVCMSVNERERCNLAPSLADGWGHVLYLEGPPLWFRQMMSVFWALGLGGLIGLCARSWRSALGFATALAIVGYIGTLVSPDVRPSLFHGSVLVAGALIGALLQKPVVWLWRELRPT